MPRPLKRLASGVRFVRLVNALARVDLDSTADEIRRAVS
jgi:hypothetical protein